VKIVCVVVGGVKGPLARVVEDYAERAGHYWRTDWIEVDAGARGRTDAEGVMEAEAQRILSRLPDRAQVAALTRGGKGMTSTGLSRWIQRAAVDGRDVAFVIGGAFGLHPSVLDRADRMLSLSPMTMPHEIARLVLAEQIYRAGTISRNEPYHKGSRMRSTNR
jgi:23S rRNA (pseudouridine1915-N3)-methyltransferase